MSRGEGHLWTFRSWKQAFIWQWLNGRQQFLCHVLEGYKSQLSVPNSWCGGAQEALERETAAGIFKMCEYERNSLAFLLWLLVASAYFNKTLPSIPRREASTQDSSLYLKEESFNFHPKFFVLMFYQGFYLHWKSRVPQGCSQGHDCAYRWGNTPGWNELDNSDKFTPNGRNRALCHWGKFGTYLDRIILPFLGSTGGREKEKLIHAWFQ